jgi:DNA-binding CsgD family transcriptional regulator
VSTARIPAIAAPAWTPKLIAERLVEAVDVLARLPEEQARGFYDLWPKILGGPYTGPGRAAAAPEAIDRMDEALAWLGWLDPEERRLTWLRAEGLSWKRIAYRLGIGRTTAWQRWTMALLKIASRLNAAAEQKRPNTIPLNRSRQIVVHDR